MATIYYILYLDGRDTVTFFPKSILPLMGFKESSEPWVTVWYVFDFIVYFYYVNLSKKKTEMIIPTIIVRTWISIVLFFIGSFRLSTFFIRACGYCDGWCFRIHLRFKEIVCNYFSLNRA